jgi:hypothetical protein
LVRQISIIGRFYPTTGRRWERTTWSTLLKPFVLGMKLNLLNNGLL